MNSLNIKELSVILSNLALRIDELEKKMRTLYPQKPLRAPTYQELENWKNEGGALYDQNKAQFDRHGYYK